MLTFSNIIENLLAAITNLLNSVWSFLSNEAIALLRSINLPAFMTDTRLFIALTIVSVIVPTFFGKKKDKKDDGDGKDGKSEISLLSKIQRVLSPILLVVGLLGSLIPPEVSVVLALLTFLVCGAFMAFTLCSAVVTVLKFLLLFVMSIVYLIQGELDDAFVLFIAFLVSLVNTACSIMLSVCSTARLFLNGIGF